MVMAGSDDDILFCINGTEHRVRRDSELAKDPLVDYLRRQTPFKASPETLLPSTRIRHTCLQSLRGCDSE